MSEKVCAQLEIARKALEAYANKKNWRGMWTLKPDVESGRIEGKWVPEGGSVDGFELAQKALKEIEDIEYP